MICEAGAGPSSLFESRGYNRGRSLVEALARAIADTTGYKMTVHVVARVSLARPAGFEPATSRLKSTALSS